MISSEQYNNLKGELSTRDLVKKNIIDSKALSIYEKNFEALIKVDLDCVEIDEDVVLKIPETMARKYNVVS